MQSVVTVLVALLSATKNKVLGRDTSLTDGDVKYPGHMAYANVAGEYFHGCKVKRFWTTRGLNEFFLPGNEGFLTLVGGIIPVAGGVGGFLVVYTKKLSARDQETVERFGREINAKITEENRKFAVEQLEQEERKAAAQIEEKRLANVGRAYEARVKKIKGESIGKERERQMKELDSGKLDE